MFLGRYVVTDRLCAPLEVKRSWRYNAVSLILNKILRFLYFFLHLTVSIHTGVRRSYVVHNSFNATKF